MRLEEYIACHHIKDIAVYGMNETGKRWYRRLTQIPTLRHIFGIEKLNYAPEEKYEKYMLYEDILPSADAVLIVPWKETNFVKWELYTFVSEHCIFANIHDFEEERMI